MFSQSKFSFNFKAKGIILLLLLIIGFSAVMLVFSLSLHKQVTVKHRNIERESINGSNAINRVNQDLNNIRQLLLNDLFFGYKESTKLEIENLYNNVNLQLNLLSKNGITTEDVNNFQNKLIEIIDQNQEQIKKLQGIQEKSNFQLDLLKTDLNNDLNELKQKVNHWQDMLIRGYQQVSGKNDELFTYYIWLFIALLSLSVIATVLLVIFIAGHRKSFNNINEELYTHQPTGLPNLKQLREDFENNIENAEKIPLYLLLIDVKANDIMVQTEGETEFNMVMLIIRDRIYQTAKENNLQTGLYRYHEGIFALISAESTLELVKATSQKILQNLQKSVEVKGKIIRVFPAIGIVAYPENAKSFNELIHHGLIALSYCKAEELQNYYVFENTNEANRRQKLSVIVKLRNSLANNEFKIYYQPRKDCKRNLITCLEAFIIWQIDDRSVSAKEFLPLARDCGLEPKIDLWVLEQVGKDITQWRNQNLAEVSIAINISATSLQQQDFIKLLTDWQNTYKINPNHLIIEVSQLSLPTYGSITTLAILNALEQLRELGIRIALDDFGTTQYAFVDLIKFPINIIKIDSQFVQNISKQYIPEQEKIVPQSVWTKALIAMSHQLNLIVVGEGVETLTQNSLLTLWGCDQIQGKFYCPILNYQRISELIKTSPQLIKDLTTEQPHKFTYNSNNLDLVL